MSDRDFSQLEMVHRLPPAALVDRFDYLCELARGRRVVHVGFVDLGCQMLNEQSGAWLHEHLSRTASELVGIDLDTDGVERARAAGTRRTRWTAATWKPCMRSASHLPTSSSRVR